MKFTQCLFAAFAAAASASPTADDFFSILLKRQEPGTPAYECHSSCGSAITQAREGGDGACEDDAFVSNYNSCLECAGPDNFNIWRYYGETLSAAGEACGFETEPSAGSGDDDSNDGASTPDDSAPAATDGVSPSETSPPDAEPTEDDGASDDDGGDTPSESGDGSEEPTSGDNTESSSPSGPTDIPQTDAAGALKAGFVGIAVAAACAGGLLV